jgi:hypothetical protein
MMQQLEHSREKMNRVPHRARDERRAARARGAPQARPRPRGRDHEADDRGGRVPARSSDRGRSQEALRRSSDRARATSTPAHTGREAALKGKLAARAIAVKRCRPSSTAATTCFAARRARASPRRRRHVQGVQHVPAAAALSSAAPRADHRAVPVVQPHHLLRAPRRGSERHPEQKGLRGGTEAGGFAR